MLDQEIIVNNLCSSTPCVIDIPRRSAKMLSSLTVRWEIRYYLCVNTNIAGGGKEVKLEWKKWVKLEAQG